MGDLSIFEYWYKPIKEDQEEGLTPQKREKKESEF